MAFFDRFRKQKPGAPTRSEASADEKHLSTWADSHVGIEGFVEPRTTVTPVTLLLVDKEGAWTRRAVPSVDWAHKFCNKRAIASYDAGLVGIPDRMRAYNKRQKQQALDELKDL